MRELGEAIRRHPITTAYLAAVVCASIIVHIIERGT